MRTKNGIELNLNESKFVFLSGNLKFYFSSEFYMKKFENERRDFNKIESIKLKNKYRVNVLAQEYFDIALYKKIEKRGFFIKDTKNNKEIPEDISFKVILNE